MELIKLNKEYYFMKFKMENYFKLEKEQIKTHMKKQNKIDDQEI